MFIYIHIRIIKIVNSHLLTIAANPFTKLNNFVTCDLFFKITIFII